MLFYLISGKMTLDLCCFQFLCRPRKKVDTINSKKNEEDKENKNFKVSTHQDEVKENEEIANVHSFGGSGSFIAAQVALAVQKSKPQLFELHVKPKNSTIIVHSPTLRAASVPKKIVLDDQWDKEYSAKWVEWAKHRVKSRIPPLKLCGDDSVIDDFLDLSILDKDYDSLSRTSYDSLNDDFEYGSDEEVFMARPSGIHPLFKEGGMINTNVNDVTNDIYNMYGSLPCADYEQLTRFSNNLCPQPIQENTRLGPHQHGKKSMSNENGGNDGVPRIVATGMQQGSFSPEQDEDDVVFIEVRPRRRQDTESTLDLNDDEESDKDFLSYMTLSFDSDASESNEKSSDQDVFTEESIRPNTPAKRRRHSACPKMMDIPVIKIETVEDLDVNAAANRIPGLDSRKRRLKSWPQEKTTLAVPSEKEASNWNSDKIPPKKDLSKPLGLFKILNAIDRRQHEIKKRARQFKERSDCIPNENDSNK